MKGESITTFSKLTHRLDPIKGKKSYQFFVNKRVNQTVINGSKEENNHIVNQF